MAFAPIEKYKGLSLPVKASLWFFVSRLMKRGISVITTPIFTRIMSTEEYGMWTNFNAWLDVLLIFITLKLYMGVFVKGLVQEEEEQKRDEYSSSLQGLTTVLAFIALLVYLPLRGFWNSLTGLPTIFMLLIIVSSWATAIFGFWSARQRVEYRYRILMFVTVGTSLLHAMLGIIAVLLFPDAKVEARAIVMVAIEVVCYTGMFVVCWARGKKFYDRKHWTRAVKTNVPLVPHYLSQIVLSQFDRIMIARMVGMGAAGIYGLAYSLSWMMTMVNQSIHSALEPWLYERIKKKETDEIARVSYLLILLVGIGNLLLIAVAPEIVAIFAPPAYYEAIWVIPPISASVFVVFMYNLFACFGFYYEYTKYIAAASMAGAVLNVVLNAIFIPMFGFLAAGYTTFVSYVLNILMHYRFMRVVQKREMDGVRVYDPKILILSVVVFCLVAALFTALYTHTAVRLTVLGVMLVVLFVKRNTFIALFKKLKK